MDQVRVIIVYFPQEILCEAGLCLRNVSLLIYLLREGESEGRPHAQITRHARYRRMQLQADMDLPLNMGMARLLA